MDEGHACLDVTRCACVCTCVIVYGGARLRVCAYVRACALPGFGPLLVPLAELVAERGEQVVHEPSGGARVVYLEVSVRCKENAYREMDQGWGEGKWGGGGGGEEGSMTGTWLVDASGQG